MKQIIKGSYAGIGSRETPESILNIMTALAHKLEKDGWWLNSGGARGADTAFAMGVVKSKTIYVPWDGYNGLPLEYPISSRALDLASKHHPAWMHLNDAAKYLMARNCYQIFSDTLDDPVKFVICWTPDGCYHDSTRTKATGGTGLAISLASLNNIPVFNLFNAEHLKRIEDYLIKPKGENVSM